MAVNEIVRGVRPLERALENRTDPEAEALPVVLASVYGRCRVTVR